VDGEVVLHPGVVVLPTARVEVDDKVISLPSEVVYWAFHKPKGYLTSRGDPHGRPTVYDCLPEDFSRLHYVGRLDQDSRGLLLFTDDGDLTLRLTHPRYQVEREYEVVADEPLIPGDIEHLLAGVDLGEGEVGRCSKVVELGPGRLRLTLKEGKKREIRRMLAGLGLGVVDLLRVAYGGVRLANLPEGQFRPLSANEIRALQDVFESEKKPTEPRPNPELRGTSAMPKSAVPRRYSGTFPRRQSR
jgi:23S rRNA pseudouridine2605 synthase